MKTDRETKVLEYESFLNERLKQDLRNVLDQRDKIYEEISEYLQLQSTIHKIQEDVTPQCELKTKVDIGCNFYVQANVWVRCNHLETESIYKGYLEDDNNLFALTWSDPSKICVAIGYGFFLEMTLPEALSFIGKKTERLQEKAAELTQEACKIKAHIKLVLEGLRELQGLSSETIKPYRDILS